MTNFKIQILRNGNWVDLQVFKHDNENIIKNNENPFDRLEYWYRDVVKEKTKCRLVIETIEVIRELPYVSR